MQLTIQPVLPNFLHQTWDLVSNFLESGLRWAGGDYTLDQTKLFLSRGEWVLIVAVDETNTVRGASAISFINMPNDRIAFVITMGGKLICSPETYTQFSDLLKTYGATKIQGAARESAARLYAKFGLTERYRIVEAKL